MVPTETVAGQTTSLESKQDETALIYNSLHLLDERVKKPLEEKGNSAPASA